MKCFILGSSVFRNGNKRKLILDIHVTQPTVACILFVLLFADLRNRLTFLGNYKITSQKNLIHSIQTGCLLGIQRIHLKTRAID